MHWSIGIFIIFCAYQIHSQELETPTSKSKIWATFEDITTCLSSLQNFRSQLLSTLWTSRKVAEFKEDYFAITSLLEAVKLRHVDLFPIFSHLNEMKELPPHNQVEFTIDQIIAKQDFIRSAAEITLWFFQQKQRSVNLPLSDAIPAINMTFKNLDEALDYIILNINDCKPSQLLIGNILNNIPVTKEVEQNRIYLSSLLRLGHLSNEQWDESLAQVETKDQALSTWLGNIIRKISKYFHNSFGIESVSKGILDLNTKFQISKRLHPDMSAFYPSQYKTPRSTTISPHIAEDSDETVEFPVPYTFVKPSEAKVVDHSEEPASLNNVLTIKPKDIVHQRALLDMIPQSPASNSIEQHSLEGEQSEEKSNGSQEYLISKRSWFVKRFRGESTLEVEEAPESRKKIIYIEELLNKERCEYKNASDDSEPSKNCIHKVNTAETSPQRTLTHGNSPLMGNSVQKRSFNKPRCEKKTFTNSYPKNTVNSISALENGENLPQQRSNLRGQQFNAVEDPTNEHILHVSKQPILTIRANLLTEVKPVHKNTFETNSRRADSTMEELDRLSNNYKKQQTRNILQQQNTPIPEKSPSLTSPSADILTNESIECADDNESTESSVTKNDQENVRSNQHEDKTLIEINSTIFSETNMNIPGTSPSSVRFGEPQDTTTDQLTQFATTPSNILEANKTDSKENEADVLKKRGKNVTDEVTEDATSLAKESKMDVKNITDDEESYLRNVKGAFTNLTTDINANQIHKVRVEMLEKQPEASERPNAEDVTTHQPFRLTTREWTSQYTVKKQTEQPKASERPNAEDMTTHQALPLTTTEWTSQIRNESNENVMMNPKGDMSKSTLEILRVPVTEVMEKTQQIRNNAEEKEVNYVNNAAADDAPGKMNKKEKELKDVYINLLATTEKVAEYLKKHDAEENEKKRTLYSYMKI